MGHQEGGELALQVTLLLCCNPLVIHAQEFVACGMSDNQKRAKQDQHAKGLAPPPLFWMISSSMLVREQ